MADQPKKKLMPLPPPAPVYIKLLVTKDLQVGNVFYRIDDEIEVFHHEAVALLDKYADCFEVQIS